MRIWRSTDPQPTSDTERLWVYNGLDCCVTLEVFHAIHPQLDEVTSKTYDFAMALQAPILEMECRGILMDVNERAKVTKLFEEQLAFVEENLRVLLKDGLNVEINWRSPQQLMHLFYEVMGLQRVRNRDKITVDRKALEKLKGNFYAEPIINHIQLCRDLKKKLQVLKTSIDPDGRIRTSYNIAGTDTGRLSSYTSAQGSGTNLQNITGELRQIFVADKGMKFGSVDGEQIQSRIVGAICWNAFKDGSYLDACESSDLHTVVCKLCWPDLPWTGNMAADKKLCSTLHFYRVDTYRQASKKLGHATNFFGKPPQVAKEINIPVGLVEEFRRNYLRSFPGIEKRFAWTRERLMKDGFITTMTGRRRFFFGRRWEDDTLRAALAYEPQEVEAYILNHGLMNIHKHAKHSVPMLHGHDSLLLMYREEEENEAIEEATRLMRIEVPLLYGRSLIVPTEAKVGWNWSDAVTQEDVDRALAKGQKPPGLNLDGLVKFSGTDKRKRTSAPSSNFMDRRVF